MTVSIAQRPATTAEARQIAADAFIYAYPMLINYKSLYTQALDPLSKSYTGGFGRFRHLSQPATPATKDIVTPNNDTLYSWAWLDLRAEPWVLSLPATPRDRYNVFQLVDLYTFNYAYVGVRATGFGPGNYLLAGPHWRGQAGPEITRILHSETDFVGILGRTSESGPDDIAAVQALQAQYFLTSLSQFEKMPAQAAAPPVQWLKWDGKKALSPAFIGYLNFILQFTQPAHPSESALMARFARIGVGAGFPFAYGQLDSVMQQALLDGVKDGAARLKDAVEHTKSSLGLFGSREALKNDYLKRAVAAAAGIYGNSAEEAVYMGTRKDDEGTPLDGRKRYVLKFSEAQLPPAKFFWSTTMYGLPDRRLVANSINRYSIGDRTKGIQYGTDGSLTLYVQRESPGADKNSNWLPCPAQGPFAMITRIYGPSEAAATGKWVMPSPAEIR
jgi:hypothetical protein